MHTAWLAETTFYEEPPQADFKNAPFLSKNSPGDLFKTASALCRYTYWYLALFSREQSPYTIETPEYFTDFYFHLLWVLANQGSWFLRDRQAPSLTMRT